MVGSLVVRVPISLPVHKDYVDFFSVAVRKMQEAGRYEQSKKTHESRTKQESACQAASAPGEQSLSAPIESMLGTLIIAVALQIIALVLVAVEHGTGKPTQALLGFRVSEEGEDEGVEEVADAPGAGATGIPDGNGTASVLWKATGNKVSPSYDTAPSAYTCVASGVAAAAAAAASDETASASLISAILASCQPVSRFISDVQVHPEDGPGEMRQEKGDTESEVGLQGVYAKLAQLEGSLVPAVNEMLAQIRSQAGSSLPVSGT